MPSGRGGSKGGVAWVMTLPLGPRGATRLQGAPPAQQGHHSLSEAPGRGTTGLPGAPTCLAWAPQAFQCHHRLFRGTTVPFRGTRTPQACQGHHLSSRGTTRLPWASQVCQGHHLSSGHTTGLPGAPVRGTTSLPGALQACQGHNSPFQEHHGTTDLSEAPQVCMPGAPGRGTTSLPVASHSVR